MKCMIEISAACGRKATKHVCDIKSMVDVQEPCVEQDVQSHEEPDITPDEDDVIEE